MMQIRATRNPAWLGDGVEIRILNKERGEYVKSVELAKLQEGSEIPPAACLTLHQAQVLIDQLWECGLRPTEGTGSAGALAAIERHLADMKRVAFHALKIQQP